MIEIHPFKPFVPENATVLILGSFPGMEQTRGTTETEQWFYSAKRNTFWKILGIVYSTNFNTVKEKQCLFTEKGIAITDIILKAVRKEESNLDKHLSEIEYNTKAIEEIFSTGKIKKVFFTSKFVETHFKKLFSNISFAECLPSPSPRYARISLEEKTKIYKLKLPK